MNHSRTPRPALLLDESFTLTARGGGGFAMVEAALTRKLTVLATRPGRTAVIVGLEDEHGANHYTQALVDREHGAWVEAVSNHYIEGEDHLLTEDHHRLLAALGFAPPDEAVPNHHLVLDQPVDWSHVGALLVRTLEAVYGVTLRTPFRVSAFDVARLDPPDREDGPS